jgi:dephospho-CoA kinase
LTGKNGAAIKFIAREFGEEFIDFQGAMNRIKMREYIFSDPKARYRLEKILHPLIEFEAITASEKKNGPYLIFVIPLLFESRNWKKELKRVLVVDCEEHVQIQRVMKRNLFSKAQVSAIMATQISRKKRLQEADDTIFNCGKLIQTSHQVKRMHALYEKLS